MLTCLFISYIKNRKRQALLCIKQLQWQLESWSECVKVEPWGSRIWKDEEDEEKWQQEEE